MLKEIQLNINMIILEEKTKIISGTKTLLSCEYDALGRVTSQTDGENNKTTYSYDEVGNLIGVTNPLNQKNII